MGTDQTKTVLKKLLEKPALAWEIGHGLMEMGVIAGPWTPVSTTNCTGMYRDSLLYSRRVVSIRGFDNKNVWEIIFHGKTQRKDKKRTAPRSKTLVELMAEVDAELEAQGTALVPTTELPPTPVPIPPQPSQPPPILGPWKQDGQRPYYERYGPGGLLMAAVKGVEPNGHTDWVIWPMGGEVSGSEIGIDAAKRAADEALVIRGYAIIEED